MASEQTTSLSVSEAYASGLKDDAAEIGRLRTWLQSIVDCWDARSDLYTSDTDAAENFADRAAAALKGKGYG